MPSLVIGFVGLGIMGFPMANSLHEAGYPLVVYDINKERVRALVELDAVEWASPRRVAEQSEVLITMLPDTPYVEQVAFRVDVLKTEPPSLGELANLDQAVLTPHIGGYTDETLRNLDRACVVALSAALHGH